MRHRQIDTAKAVEVAESLEQITRDPGAREATFQAAVVLLLHDLTAAVDDLAAEVIALRREKGK
jgi:hypothetical protein